MKARQPSLRTRSLRITSLSLLCALAPALPACADPEPRDLGFTQSTEDLSVEDTTTPFFSPTSDFIGRWVGVAQETLALGDDGASPTYQFPSGSTQILIEVVPGEYSYLTGRIVFGAGAPLPPPVDPDVGYPVGVAYDSLLGYEYTPSGDDFLQWFNGFGFSGLPPFEGFEYRLDQGGTALDHGDGRVDVADGVATFTFNSMQPLDPWCELQTPQKQSGGGYSCAPDFGGGWTMRSDGSGALCDLGGDVRHCEDVLPDFAECNTEANDYECDFSEYDACIGEPAARVNCDKLFMCRAEFCECDSQSCNARPFTTDSLSVRRVGDELIGLFANTTFKNARGLNVPLGEVRLHLEP
jgi:hypothetical protein